MNSNLLEEEEEEIASSHLFLSPCIALIAQQDYV